MASQRKIQKMRKALKKSNTRLLLSSVAIFQLLAMLLISLRGEVVSTQALILAAAIPLATILVTTIMGKLSGMLNVEVFKSNDLPDIDSDSLDAPDEPTGYDDFTAEGDPTEIGEQGDPDKFADIEEPIVEK